MLQITPQMKILVAVEPADFRRGIDGLAALCKSSLREDPFAGTVFVFRNRRATSIKLLVYDGQGFWLCQKRLSSARFRWWPVPADASGDQATQALAAHQLAVLLSAGNPQATAAAPDWRPVGPRR
jgi:transposase